MANRIQLRRGSAQEWSNVNPTLAIGELGIEIDTGRIKIGDGVTAWNSLRYERPLESVTNSANTLVQRDADGNFSAGSITATLVGNAATATRLANVRQIALSGDVTGSATFDGSANLNISSALGLIPTLPHYDGTVNSSGTYIRVTVDAKGRIVDGENPTNIADFGLAGTVEGESAQAFDRDLQAIADLSTTGILTRVSDGNVATRTVTGTPGRISVVNGSGVAGNPTLDLINTTVTQGTYNTPSIAGNTQTIRATRFTVDQWGRLTYAEDFPIATAVEGTISPTWATGNTYSRYDKVVYNGRLYEALTGGTSGATPPSHTSGDASDGAVTWRHQGVVTTRQKGLASFAQEDFDVNADGHVSIAFNGVDNTQLQNNQIRFADGSSFTSYELDNELTASTGYRGLTTINDLSVNDTSGNPLIRSINSTNPATSNLDVNTVTANIFSDITLDKTSTAVQTINRAGSLTLLMDANTASNRFLRILAQNAGTGEGKMEIIADDSILFESSNSTISITSPQQISLISSGADVRVEDIYFAGNAISSTNSTIVLDPAGVGNNTGTVQIKGDLLVDGTTVTVNSTTMTVDDPIITLGGDTAPVSTDGKDRGVEFRYYDTQARLGFYGWDASYTTLAGTTGGYRFLYDASNTSEVFSGTDAGIVAGNLALSSNVGSTSTTTGTLVVTGGTGISENLWIGGNVNVATNTTLQGTLSLTGNATLNSNVTIVGSDTAATEFFRIRNGSSADRFVVDTSSGNTSITGTLDVTDNVTLNKNVTIVGSNTAATELFRIRNASSTDRFTVDTANGNTLISGTLGVTGATTLSSTLGVTGATTLTGDLTLQSTSYLYSQNVDAPTITTDGSNNYVISGGDYGSFRFDGGGYIAEDVLFAKSIYVNGAINVKDAGDTGAASTVNNIAVRYRATLGTQIAYTPSYASDTSTNLRVIGGAGIQTDLYVGDDFYVGKLNSGDTVKFSVLGENGNTSISGTLGVTGNVTFTGDLAVNGGDITSTSATASIFNSSVTNLNIGQAATTVSIGATTGTLTIRNSSTVITGNLTVNGTTTTVNSTTITVDDPIITLGGDTAPASDDNKDRGVEFRYFDVSAKLGFFGWDDSSAGYRFLENATNTSEVFSGTDAALYAGSLSLSKAGTALSVTNNATIGGTLGVTGATTLSGTLAVTGTSTLTDQLTANGGALIKNLRVGLTAVNEIDTSVGNLILDSAGGTVQVDDNLTVTGTLTSTAADIVGTARDARKWTTARTITLGTDLSGSVSLDGSNNVTLGATLTNTGVTAGTYTKVTVDTKGRVTSATSASTSDVTEGSNLYFTDERAQDAVATALTTNASHNGISVSYNDAGNAINISRNTLSYSYQNYSGNGSRFAFTANAGRTTSDILVVVDRLMQTPVVDYNYFDQVVYGSVGGHSGENTITVPSNAGLTTGMPVSGNGIGAGAEITNISGTTITLSVANTSFLKRATVVSIGTPVGTNVPGAANQTYTNVSSTTSGAGSGATFNVSRGAAGVITSVTINDGGTNYSIGDTIVIPGANVGGTTPTNNITFTVTGTTTTNTIATFSPIVKFTSAPSAGSNNVTVRYLPL
ncbi:tail fiber [Synechococcus phage S-CREM1]|nr:tail fiber [Synechococcus phage S-CREM1]